MSWRRCRPTTWRSPRASSAGCRRWKASASTPPSSFRACSRRPRSSPPSPSAPIRTAPSCGSRTWGGRNWGPSCTTLQAVTTASPSGALAIRQAAGANALDTANAIRAKLDEMSRYFPHGMKVVYPYDTTPFTRVAIEEVVKTLFEAIVLVFVVMYLFMGNIRATLIPTIAVPVVLLGTFARPGALRVLHQHADHVRHGAGHRPAGGRRHRGGGERGADHERGGPFAQGGHRASRWTRSPAP